MTPPGPARSRAPTPTRAQPPLDEAPRVRTSWFRRAIVNAALFAVGGTIALFLLRFLSPPVATVAPPPTVVSPADSDAAPRSSAAGVALDSAGQPYRHPPAVVVSPPRVDPVVVQPRLRIVPIPLPIPRLLLRTPMERARGGAAVPVNVTAYCLQGLTRRDHLVRRGIVAADPRYFPLGRSIDLTIGFGYHGRYLVDDTGKDIQGLRLDIWTESCTEARRFGRRFGSAKLVPR